MLERLKDGRVLALLVAMIYSVVPVDLIPDLPFGLGLVDDVGVSTAMTVLAWWWSREREGGMRDLWPLIALLVYDVSPVDLVPEAILPGVGEIDDAGLSVLVPLLWAWWKSRTPSITSEKPE